MFAFCAALVSAPSMNNWDVSKVTDMQEMFYFASSFNQPIGNWDVSAVTNMSGMFREGAAFNQPIGNWDISAVTDVSFIFQSAISFNQSLGDWIFRPFVNAPGLLIGVGMDCSNYSNTLIGWAADTTSTAIVDIGAFGKTYGQAATNARDELIARGWTISGDVLDPTCAVLPVKLISFSAKAFSGNLVEIKWETEQETDNERFVVERSKDLTSFETAVEIRDVAGNSNTLHTYQVIDPTPYIGTSYYRLVQYDLDGGSTKSRAVSVVVRSRDYAVYPNPVENQSFLISVDDIPQVI